MSQYPSTTFQRIHAGSLPETGETLYDRIFLRDSAGRIGVRNDVPVLIKSLLRNAEYVIM